MANSNHSNNNSRKEIERPQNEVDLLQMDKYQDNPLQEKYRRLRILHEIEHAILTSQDLKTTANIALAHVVDLVPVYHSGSILAFDFIAQTADILASSNNNDQEIGLEQIFPTGYRIPLVNLPVDIPVLQEGKLWHVEDLVEIPSLTDLQSKMRQAGIRSYITMPIIISGELVGMIFLTSSSPGVLHTSQIQVIRDISDSLAIAIGQASLESAEQQGLMEAEVMRDIMAALASAGTLNQTLEAILVNLRNVINYDRAAIYLMDDHQHYVPAEQNDFTNYGQFRSQFDDDPIISEMRSSQYVIAVADIQGDPRFKTWPDMESIHGWLGAPLVVRKEMIGFISLGSLQPGEYKDEDIALIQGFTHNISDVLEKAWLHEQSHRRTEELEVLSSLSFALDLVDSREGTLSTIVKKISEIFGAQCGTLLFPQNQDTQLRVHFSQNEQLVGLSHQNVDDPFWQVFLNGELVILRDIPGFLSHNQSSFTSRLFEDVQSAALIPIQSGEMIFGVLCLTFDKKRWITSQEINLLSSVSEIAGASLQRAAELSRLERQVSKRNQRLSTLYTINAIANESNPMEETLEQLLAIALETNNCRIGAIHLVDPGANSLILICQQGLDDHQVARFESPNLENEIWTSLLFSSQPKVIPDISSDERFPEVIRQIGAGQFKAFVCAPVRANGIPVGLLSIFRESILDYSLEDITLLMTIAGQVGASVERKRLIDQAEQAAVIEERQRLARELHDSVTQLLYSQVLFASAGQKSIALGNLDPAKTFLNRIDEAALQALKEMRILVYELAPSEALKEGLLAALEHRLEAVERRAGMIATIESDGKINLDENSELTLYRLIQEALNNTLKHSAASSVSINFHRHLDTLRVEIEDDGCGFDLHEKTQSGGMGISTMQERAAELGSELLIHTAPQQGTCIKISIKDLQ